MSRIGVIGAGFTGVSLLAHLTRLGSRAELVLIDSAPAPARGVAYSTEDPAHLLNVRASNMSALSDDSAHFVRWLRAQTYREDVADDFAPRAMYGRYLTDLLAETSSAGLVQLRRERVVDVSVDDAGVTAHYASAREAERFDHLVLCLGNFPSPLPSRALEPLAGSPRYIADPWARGALETIDLRAPVIVIGTGLTMVDLALTLQDKGLRAPIRALSRRGLLPAVHGPPMTSVPFTPPEAQIPLGALLTRIRREVVEAARAGTDWRAVFDGLRPHHARLWGALSPRDRARFFRHLRPYWDVHRHRMAIPVGEAIAAMRARGDLELHRGRVAHAELRGDELLVTYAPPLGDHHVLRGGQVINCTGTTGDYTRIDDPLLRSLLARGLARPDPMRLGLDTDPGGAVYDRQGSLSTRLSAAGPPTRAALFEITAVPEIRVQCAALAQRLSASAPSP